MSVAASFRLTAEDLAAFAEHVTFNRRRAVIRARAFWTGVVSTVLASVFLYSQFHHTIASVSAGAVFGVIVAWLLPKAERDQLRRRAARLYAEGRDSSIGEHNVTFDPSGIHSNCSSGCGSTRWEAVTAVELTPAYLFVFFGPAKGLIVPRAAFADPAAAAAELRELTQAPFAGSWSAGG